MCHYLFITVSIPLCEPVVQDKQGIDLTDKVQHIHKGHECVRDVENQALIADHSTYQITQCSTIVETYGTTNQCEEANLCSQELEQLNLRAQMVIFLVQFMQAISLRYSPIVTNGLNQ